MNTENIAKQIRESVKSKLEQVNESSLSRVYQHQNERSIGMLTAYRGDISRRENVARNRKLYGDLLSMDRDLQITRVKGSYMEETPEGGTMHVKEDVFFVGSSIEGDDEGHLESILFKLGKKYGQDSVLIKNFDEDAFLLGTSRSAEFPGMGRRVRLGKFNAGNISQFMTKIRGRPFVFESSVAMDYPQTINGIRGLKILQETSLDDLIQMED